MKKLLPLTAMIMAVLASCSNPVAQTAAEKDHAAISEELKKGLDDPASYKSVSFKLDDPWTRADSASLPEIIAGNVPAKYPRPDSTKPAGHRYQHQYRAKNKMGALVLSDITAVVYEGQKVVIMPF